MESNILRAGDPKDIARGMVRCVKKQVVELRVAFATLGVLKSFEVAIATSGVKTRDREWEADEIGQELVDNQPSHTAVAIGEGMDFEELRKEPCCHTDCIEETHDRLAIQGFDKLGKPLWYDPGWEVHHIRV